MKFKISGSELGNQLANQVSALTKKAQQGVSDAMGELAQQAYYRARDMAGARLHSTRQTYLDALKFERTGPNVYTITLGGEANHLEEGYGSYDMIKAGLARGPKSKLSKKGYRYVIIPFERKPSASNANSPDGNKQIQHQQTIEQRLAPGGVGPTAPAQGRITNRELTKGMKEAFKIAGMGKTMKDTMGNPMVGTIGKIKANPFNTKSFIAVDHKGRETVHYTTKPFDPLNSGVQKIQYKVGKSVRTAYISFRIASENPARSAKWIHPGFAGVHIMKDLEHWCRDQMPKIVEAILKVA